MKFRGGEFSTGTTGNFQSELTIKVEVKKKHISCGWNFSCFSAHLIERDLFWPTTPCARLRGNVPPWIPGVTKNCVRS